MAKRSWSNVLNNFYRGRANEKEIISSASDFVDTKRVLTVEPPVSRAEITFTGKDYFQVGQTAKLPARRAENLMQTTSDYYIYKAEKYWENEGIVFRIINKMVEMISKGEFKITADTDVDLKKFNTEFMKLVTKSGRGYTWKSFTRRVTHDFCKYGNTFLYPDYLQPGTNLIGSIKFFDPVTMGALVNKDDGELYMWVRKQVLRKRGDIEKHLRAGQPPAIRSVTNLGRYFFALIPRVIVGTHNNTYDPKYDPRELVHIPYMDLHQTVISIPPIYPVLDDILTLRNIEDDITLNSFQYGHPFLWGKIIREGMDNTQLKSEAAFLRDQVESMEGNGLIVTSDRVEMKLLGPEGTFPNLVQYHEMFLKRIEKGVGIPDIFTGDGGGVGRQTSETVEKSVFGMLEDMGGRIAQGLQQLADRVWNRNILKKSDMDSWTDPSPIRIEFGNPSRADKRADEQHHTLLFQGGALKHDEYRKAIGLTPDPAWAGKYFFEIQSQMNTEQAQAAAAAKIQSQQTATNQHMTKTQAGSVKN